MTYWIQTVAERTGIPKNTLIAWERRHGLVQPERSPSGYRLYSDADVALLLRVKELVDQGHRISQAAAILRQEGTPPLPGSGATEALPELRAELLDALLELDRPRADRVAQRLAGLPHEVVVDWIYLPLLEQIGEGWASGEVSVAAEHHATAYCREQIAVMMRHLSSGGAGAPEAVCATPEGERHEVGLLRVALRLAHRGFRLTYLGVDVPTTDLRALLAERSPALLCLSVVLDRPGHQLLELARQLSEAAPQTILIFGGPAVADLEDQSTEQIWFATSLDPIDRIQR